MIIWHVLLATCITLATGEPARPNVCKYLQCMKSSQTVANHTVIKYNKTIWEAHNLNENVFDFRAWNWTELDDLAHEGDALVEVIFNGLDIVQIDSLDGHDNVMSLNLDGNGIQNVEKNAFGQFRRLINLSLRANMISAIDHGYFYYDSKIENLDISQNVITTLVGFKDLTWASLIYLNASHNHIEHVTNQLVKLDKLEWVDLSYNRIARTDGPLMLPRNLRDCILNNNNLTIWPFDSVPGRLRHLCIGFNLLNSTKPASGLRKLDLSHNRLAVFCSECFPNLEELDISGNYLDTVPDWSASMDISPLKKISFNRMPFLRVIKNNSFSKTANLKEIEISTCPELANIEENAFTSLTQLQKLDLSYNGLQQVHENIVHWNRIKHGVNLQGNPFRCDCSMQWFLDRVISEMLSDRELHALFPDLRCTSPSIYKNQLLVRLTIHDNVLCRTTRMINEAGMVQIITSDEDHLVEKVILCCLIVANIVTLFYLVYLKNKRQYKIIPIYS
uniref:LRRCT domain-containing protein n=1 Tax=Anopheles atroparvus TaxID=41427 RepID=A0AAG5DFP8_ANOAO